MGTLVDMLTGCDGSTGMCLSPGEGFVERAFALSCEERSGEGTKVRSGGSGPGGACRGGVGGEAREGSESE